MKKILSLFLSLVMVLGILTSMPLTVNAASTYENEDNDSYSTANIITIGNTISGSLGSGGDNDFYKIVAPANGKITIDFCHIYSEGSYSKAWNVTVYQYSDGNYLELTSQDITSTDNEKIALPYIGAVKKGIYYIKVKSFGSYSYIVGEEYKISTTFIESNYFEKEHNNSYSSASMITLDKKISGTINNAQDSDFYKIVAPANGKITIDFCHSYSEGSYSKAWNVTVYQYSDGNYLELTSQDIISTDNEKIALPYIGAVKNGIYYIKVKSFGSYNYIVGEDYKIATTFTKSNYFEKENNNTYSSATSITLGKKFSGTINNAQDSDFYKIIAPVNGKITLNFYHTNGEGSYSKAWNVSIYQYKNGTYTELSNQDIKYTDDEKESLPPIGAVKKTTYYIKVKSFGGYNYISGENYQILASVYLPTPKLADIDNTTSGVKVTWGKVSGADSYYVYRKTKGGSWSKIGTASSTSYTDKTAKSGTTYYYTVRAKNEAGLSSYNSTGLSMKRLANPKLSKTQNTTSGVKITWGKVTGASGYIVYRKTKGGSWKQLGKTTKTYYTDKTAKSGTTYYYTVRAYSGSVKSYYDTTGLKIKYLADPTLKTPTSTKNGVSLKWTKTTGASGYIIYRKIGSGSYTKLKTEKGVSNLSYVDKSAKKGKKYTYKVRAYYSKTYSAYSNTKTIKDKY